MAQLGGSVYLRRSVEWWWGLRAQEPVLLGDGGRDALAVCHVRGSGGSCSSPVTVVMVSGGGAAVFRRARWQRRPSAARRAHGF